MRAAPGSVASDGTGKNGLYTQNSSKAIDIHGLLIETSVQRGAEKTFEAFRRKAIHVGQLEYYR
jgi:hypothetical protein